MRNTISEKLIRRGDLNGHIGKTRVHEGFAIVLRMKEVREDFRYATSDNLVVETRVSKREMTT